jgi:hemolysin type calcium-binding protein
MHLRGRCLLGVLVASLAVSVPGPMVTASTLRASVRVVEGELRYVAAPGVSDDLYVYSRSGAETELRFLSANDMRAGTGCTRRSRTTIGVYRLHCDGVSSVEITLGTGADVLYLFGEDPATVHGGSGADFVETSSANDTLIGGTGPDRLRSIGGRDSLIGGSGDDELFPDWRGSASQTNVPDDALDGGSGQDLLFAGGGADELLGGTGDDELIGGAGNDHFVGEPGADEILGGGGPLDEIDCSHRVRDVTVDDHGGLANDGSAGEGDDVGAVEVVRTGSGNDTVSLGDFRARVFGNRGDDTLTLTRGPGVLFGGLGDDTLTLATTFPGRVRAGAGDDHISTGGSTSDRDGCGPGNDAVTADASDLVSDNCEEVAGT